jgi:photosystem II stability/assembly factor-like uncharacterized protein
MDDEAGAGFAMRLDRTLTQVAICALLAAAAHSVRATTPESSPAAIVIGDTPVTVAESMRNDATLADICFIDPTRGWAVGDRGVIWHTADGGRTWQLQASGVACRLKSVCFIDAERGWAAGGAFEPYTHASRGIVLVTNDGGATWSQLPQPTLPAISRIKFFDARRGLAAGFGSAAEPSGVYETRDGGQTWEPLPADGQGLWLAADFVDGGGAVAGPAGQFATLARRRVVHGPAAMALTRSYRALRLAPPTGGWLVGDGGLVMTTRDLGHSWQTPTGDLPPFASEHFDFHAVATLGKHVWIAGSPGTRLFHSPDNGASWEVLSTGHRLPVRALTFADANTGWAAGELGTILATTDGGQTWGVQHQGGDRAAVLGVFAHPGNVPLEAIAKYGGEEAYLAAVSHVLPTADPLEAARADDAMSTAGATASDAAWRFPLSPPDRALPLDDLVAELNRANDGRALARIEDHLVRQLRMWRPEIVLTQRVPVMDDDPTAALVEQVLARSIATAADPAKALQIGTDVGLPPWQVKQVFGVLPKGSKGDVRITAGEFAPRLGGSLADTTTPARGLLETSPKPPPDITEIARLTRSSSTTAASTDLFDGVRLTPGGDARRRLANLPEEDMAKLRQLAARRRQMQGLLSRAQGSVMFEAQLATLIQGLDAESGGELLFQLAEGYRAQGRLDLAADTFSAFARKWPEHRLVEPALRWLVQFYASGEAAHRIASRGALNMRAENEITSANAVQQASAAMNRSPAVGLSRDDRLRRAALLGQYIESSRPALYAEPSIRFPLVVAQRQLGFANPAKRYYLELGGRAESDAWRRCGETEEWLAKSTGNPPPKPLGTCRRWSERPHLDGKLNEPLWKSADRLRLRFEGNDLAPPANGPDTPGDSRAADSSFASFTYDGSFLYLAIKCPKASGCDYTADSRPRPRDADLARYDRVTIQLDVDRDYATAYELTVDHRGWTHDGCWGDVNWNPKWFVAASANSTSWTAEVAIPLAELVPESPATKHVWAVSVKRTVPGGQPASWAGGAADAESPDRFGLLLFE